MAKTKWEPSAKLSLAIAKVEEQQTDGKGLLDWNTGSHLACIRYLVNECVAADGKLDKAMLKAEFAKESAFLGYASNGKKLLQESGLLGKSEVGAGYE